MYTQYLRHTKSEARPLLADLFRSSTPREIGRDWARSCQAGKFTTMATALYLEQYLDSKQKCLYIWIMLLIYIHVYSLDTVECIWTKICGWYVDLGVQILADEYLITYSLFVNKITLSLVVKHADAHTAEH